MATITGPGSIIADEPTTALDVTVQAQIPEILRALKNDRNTAIAMISHDMGADRRPGRSRAGAMAAGEIVESGTADEIFYAPRRDYTRTLLAFCPAVPTIRPHP